MLRVVPSDLIPVVLASVLVLLAPLLATSFLIVPARAAVYFVRSWLCDICICAPGSQVTRSGAGAGFEISSRHLPSRI